MVRRLLTLLYVIGKIKYSFSCPFSIFISRICTTESVSYIRYHIIRPLDHEFVAIRNSKSERFVLYIRIKNLSRTPMMELNGTIRKSPENIMFWGFFVGFYVKDIVPSSQTISVIDEACVKPILSIAFHCAIVPSKVMLVSDSQLSNE